MRPALRLGFWLAIAAVVSAAQTREVARPAVAGTARLAGRVVGSEENGQPLRRAIVTISAAELGADRGTITDDNGRFAFGSLPAGRYTIKAAKPAYIPTAFGARRPGGAGTAVALAADEHLENLTIGMVRGGVITGAVRDASNQPVPNVQVSAIRADAPADARAVAPGSDTFVTDDRGVYRIFGLVPGEYLVAATPRTTGLGDVVILTPAEIDAALARAGRGRAVTSTGAGRGVPAPSGPPPESPPQTVFGFPPIFHPGTASVSDASRVTLAAGVERSGVDIVLGPARAAVIEGVISRADGGPVPTVTLSLGAAGPALPQGFGTSPNLVARPGADGRFKYTGVLPGRYTLTARSASATQVELSRAQQLAGRGLVTADTPTRMASQPSLYALVDLTVVEDLHGVMLVLQPMLTLKGRVVFEGQSTTPPADVTTLRITLGPPMDATPSSAPQVITADGRVLASSGLVAGAQPNAEGSFEILNIMPETYRLSLPLPTAKPGQGWWLKSVMSGGRDLLDTLVDVRTSLSDVVVTLSDRHSELSGVLETVTGQPATDSFLIVFSADRSMWGPHSRRVATTRPASDGAFRFLDLPAGDYFLAALSDIDQDEWRDPAFLAQVAAAGSVRITLADGERKTQNVRMSR